MNLMAGTFKEPTFSSLPLKAVKSVFVTILVIKSLSFRCSGRTSLLPHQGLKRLFMICSTKMLCFTLHEVGHSVQITKTVILSSVLPILKQYLPFVESLLCLNVDYVAGFELK